MSKETKNVDLLPPSNDYIFANLFGKKSHERVLVCLLNSILNGKPHIKSVKLEPTEYKKTSVDGKTIRLDIVATSDEGAILNVEIQCKRNGNIEDRASFYKARLRSSKLKEGEDYSSVPDIISIWICVDPETHRKGCCHEIVDMYKANGVDPVEVASEKMRHFIIELTKLEATPKTFLNDMFTIWMRFIKDPKTIPAEFLKIPEVQEAMDELTYMSSDPETRAIYDARTKELNDIYAGQTAKYKEGLEAGRAEERAKAEKREAELKVQAEEEKAELKAKAEKREKELKEQAEEEKIQSAKKLLAIGLSHEQVASAIGLTVEEVKALK